MIEFLMARLNNSVAEHILRIPLHLTRLLSATRVGVHGDKGREQYKFYQTRMFCLYVHCHHSYSFLELTFSSLFPNLSEWGNILPVLNPLEPNGYFSNTIYKIKKFYVLNPK